MIGCFESNRLDLDRVLLVFISIKPCNGAGQMVQQLRALSHLSSPRMFFLNKLYLFLLLWDGKKRKKKDLVPLSSIIQQMECRELYGIDKE